MTFAPHVSAGRPQSQDARILVIEDVKVIQKVIDSSLRDLQAECSYVENGLAGLQAVAVSLPDLIILDLALPIMSGWEFLRRFRSDPRSDDVPVLVVTAHGQSGTAIEVADLGADGFMLKPFRPDELAHAVDHLLRNGRPFWSRHR